MIFEQDLRYAWRLTRRRPVFTIVVALTLALGIGANTAIFTLTDAVLLQRLPVSEPDRLVSLDRITTEGRRANDSLPMVQRVSQEASAFAGVFAVQDDIRQIDLTDTALGGRTQPASVLLVSGGYFPVLGVRAFIGRTLTPDDDGARDRQAVAVISHAFWARRFDRDPAIVGRTLLFGQTPFTIVGVAPAGFFGETVGAAPDFWAPLTMQPSFDRGASMLDDPNVGWLRTLARLGPDVTRERAGAALGVLLDRLRAEPGAIGRTVRNTVSWRVSDASRGLSTFRDQFALPLRILAVVVAVVLLIACANVSNLLLARATARRQEIAVRLAMGASRGRLVRQLLTESLLLAAIGGLLGLLFASWGSRTLLVLLSSDGTPLPIDLAPDARILAFTTIVSLAAVAIFGLVPAWSATRAAVTASLRQGPGARSGARLSPILLVGQVALSLLLVTGAALFLQTVHNLRTRDLGFVSDALLQARIDPWSSGIPPAQHAELSSRVLARLVAAPGVQAATMAHSGFATGTSRTCCIAIEGRTFEPGEERQVRTLAVGPDYFQTVGLRLRQGRDFVPRDVPVQMSSSAGAVIVNQAFVRRYLGAGNPIGKRIGWGDPPKVTFGMEVVGVANDALYNDLRGDSLPLIYMPSPTGHVFSIRAAGAPAQLVATIRREIQAASPNLAIAWIRPVSEDVERALVREKLLATLSGFFGALAVTLAAIGLYGLMAYAVASRTRDIGVRMALGASGGVVLRSEIWAALRLVLAGIAIGVPIALAAGSSIAAQLFGVAPTDPVTLAGAALLLSLVAALAAYGPARRASRVDPMLALRAE